MGLKTIMEAFLDWDDEASIDINQNWRILQWYWRFLMKEPISRSLKELSEKHNTGMIWLE